jgi:hypothetical protein
MMMDGVSNDETNAHSTELVALVKGKESVVDLLWARTSETVTAQQGLLRIMSNGLRKKMSAGTKLCTDSTSDIDILSGYQCMYSAVHVCITAKQPRKKTHLVGRLALLSRKL